MENKKYEQLIDLIINEQEDKARELFHDIVVEKSREIYESIMDEEMTGEVGDLMDEISAEESGDVVEGEDDADIAFDDEAEEAGDDLTQDLEVGHDAEEAGEEPQDLDDVKDKFEQLLADFDRLLSGGEAGEEDFGGEEDLGGEEGGEEDFGGEEEEEVVAEAVQLQKVSVTHGDNGSNTKSPSLNQPKVKAAGVNPVKFSGASESVPTSPKGPSNEYSKKEGTLIGDVGNTPGNKKAPTLKAAPKPTTSQASGVNTKSPVSKA